MQARATGGLRQLNKPLANGLHFGVRYHLRKVRGHSIVDEPTALLRSNILHLSQQKQVVTALAENRHQVHHGVYDAPSEVATESSQQHAIDAVVIAAGNSERAGEGQYHDESEQYF